MPALRSMLSGTYHAQNYVVGPYLFILHDFQIAFDSAPHNELLLELNEAWCSLLQVVCPALLGIFQCCLQAPDWCTDTPVLVAG